MDSTTHPRLATKAKPAPQATGFVWTPPELAKLAKLYPRKSASEIAAAFGRSRSSVLSAARRSGLRKRGIAGGTA